MNFKKVLQKVLASHPDAFFTFWIVYKKTGSNAQFSFNAA